MTIAGGFLCPDGIVLCADQQITNSDFSKSTARKIWGRQYPRLSVVITGSNDWAYLESSAGRLLDALSACESLFAAKTTISETLRAIFEHDVGKEPGNRSDTSVRIEMIIGIEAAGELELIKASNLAVTPCESVWFTGAGKALAENWLMSIYPASVVSEIEVSNVREAVIVGMYILANVKKSAYGCGGNTDIYCLDRAGEIVVPTVQYLERIFPHLKILSRQLLFAQADITLSDDEFEQELGMLLSNLRRQREDNKKYRKWTNQLLEES